MTNLPKSYKPVALIGISIPKFLTKKKPTERGQKESRVSLGKTKTA